jgi:hypothetical protein
MCDAVETHTPVMDMTVRSITKENRGTPRNFREVPRVFRLAVA